LQADGGTLLVRHLFHFLWASLVEKNYEGMTLERTSLKLFLALVFNDIGSKTAEDNLVFLLVFCIREDWCFWGNEQQHAHAQQVVHCQVGLVQFATPKSWHLNCAKENAMSQRDEERQQDKLVIGSNAELRKDRGRRKESTHVGLDSKGLGWRPVLAKIELDSTGT
jgi:hypothetical protein